MSVLPDRLTYSVCVLQHHLTVSACVLQDHYFDRQCLYVTGSFDLQCLCVAGSFDLQCLCVAGSFDRQCLCVEGSFDRQCLCVAGSFDQADVVRFRNGERALLIITPTAVASTTNTSRFHQIVVYYNSQPPFQFPNPFNLTKLVSHCSAPRCSCGTRYLLLYETPSFSQNPDRSLSRPPPTPTPPLHPILPECNFRLNRVAPLLY